MEIDVALVSPEETRALRDLHRHEMNCQIIRDSWHARGYTDSYLLRVDGRLAGYGLVGGVPGDPKETFVEFFVRPRGRAAALPLFRRLVELSGARSVIAQTNDVLLTLMLYDCAQGVESDTILFEDVLTTALTAPGAVFRRAVESDEGRIFAHAVEPVGDWVIEVDGEIVATGGHMTHYNVPYGDVYMEVAEPFRQRGYGSYLVQEVKRACYEAGKVPAARCHVANLGSRATLQKAGLLPCARMLTGTLVG
jgi:GNAT superfamily N-acetyltransferase